MVDGWGCWSRILRPKVSRYVLREPWWLRHHRLGQLFTKPVTAESMVVITEQRRCVFGTWYVCGPDRYDLDRCCVLM